MKYVGALDQGTTSTRFIVFDQKGSLRLVVSLEHQRLSPARLGRARSLGDLGQQLGVHQQGSEGGHLKGIDIGASDHNQERQSLPGIQKPAKSCTMQSSGRTSWVLSSLSS